jgi:hypothetical protein
MKRALSFTLALALIACPIPVAARESTANPLPLRELLQQCHAADLDLAIQLQGGSMVGGKVAQTGRNLFDVVGGVVGGSQQIAYVDVRSIVDRTRTTGERLQFQMPGPTSRMPQGSWHKALLTVIVIGSVSFALWLMLHGST